MKNIYVILNIVLVLIMSMCIGCVSEDETYEDTKKVVDIYDDPIRNVATNNYSAIIREANKLNDACVEEIQTSNDLFEMLMDEKGTISDEDDIMLLVKQRQLQDVTCQLFIIYADKNRYVLDHKVKPIGWGTDVIRTYEKNKAMNDEWYDDVDEYLGRKIKRPDFSSSTTVDTKSTTTNTYVYGFKTELTKEFEEMLNKQLRLIEAMNNEGIIATQSMSCTTTFQKSIVDCRNNAKYFRYWIYDHENELDHDGVPIKEMYLMIDKTLESCDMMDEVCVQINEAKRYM